VHGHTIRDERYVEAFRQFIIAEYGIDAVRISPAKRGYYGETWKVEALGSAYFAKVVYPAAHKSKYRRSFPVVERLTSSGIENIPPLLKTNKGKLCSDFDGAVVGVFKWLDGDNVQNEDTRIPEYKILSKVYTVSAKGLDIPQQVFDAQAAQTLRDNLKRLDNGEVQSFFKLHADKIECYANSLANLSKRIAKLKTPRYITHGDAGGNIIAGTDGQYYLVDWDNPILVPPERDAWFCLHRTCATSAFNSALHENGIDYTLNFDIMAFYCYYFWFDYLNLYLETYFESGDVNIIREIKAYLTGWITDNMDFAEKIT
jgi:thiamine kinase-like enzyme